MSQATHPDLDPWHGILYAVIERLTPLFVGTERGETCARYAAGEAIAAFNPESRADYASIGRILALSLSAITAAARCVAPDLPEEQQIRFLTKAQSLGRTADQSERVMMTRRRLAPQDGTADTLIPRPPKRPAHYRPLPPDDPASGTAIAARRVRQEREAAAMQGETINVKSPAAKPAQNDQADPPPPPSARNEQRSPASAPLPHTPRSSHQANPAPASSQTGRIDQTKPMAQGPAAPARITPESRGCVLAGEQTVEERTARSLHPDSAGIRRDNA